MLRFSPGLFSNQCFWSLPPRALDSARVTRLCNLSEGESDTARGWEPLA